MTDVEEINVTLIRLPKDQESPLQKYKSSTTESESLKPSSQQMSKTKLSSILDLDWTNSTEIRDVPFPSIKTTLPTPSGMQGNHSSVKLETDIIVQLQVQATVEQNPLEISSSSKALSEAEEQPFKNHKNSTTESTSLQPSSQQVGEIKSSPILDLDCGNQTEIQDPAFITTMLTPSGMQDNQASVKLETDIVQLPVQETEGQNPLEMSSSSKALSEAEKPPFQNHKNSTTESKSLQPSSQQVGEIKSPILNLDCGNPTEIQDMSAPAIKTTMLTPSGMQDNHSSVKLETDIVQLPVKETESQNSLHISCPGVLPNKNVGDKNSSSISVLQIKNHIEIPLPIVIPEPGGKSLFSRYHPFLMAMLKETTLLPTLALENNETKSIKDQRLLFLEHVEVIKNWLDLIAELNKCYTERYQNVIKTIMDFNRLEEMVVEKQNLLSMGIRFTNLEIQNKDSKYESSVYESMHLNGEKLLRGLRRIKKYLDANFMKYSRNRDTYINKSIEVSLFPIEDDLFETGVNSLNLINNVSMSLNSTSVKLVEAFSFIDFFSLESVTLVNGYFNDIEVNFSL